MILYKGIDVSVWQGQIDWQKVKADHIDFAMIRVGAGERIDPRFQDNAKGAAAQDLPFGVYHFSYAATAEEAKKEALFVIENIKSYQLSYPVAIDVETTVQHEMSKEALTDLVIGFCEEIEKAGYRPMVYTSLSWFLEKLDMERLQSYEKWVAAWGDGHFENDGIYAMWQYSNKGKVAGITGNVDLNICYKKFTEDKKEYEPGEKLLLEETPLYVSADAEQAVRKISGIYWVYDGKIINNRIRITNAPQNANRRPIEQYVTGYINAE